MSRLFSYRRPSGNNSGHGASGYQGGGSKGPIYSFNGEYFYYDHVASRLGGLKGDDILTCPNYLASSGPKLICDYDESYVSQVLIREGALPYGYHLVSDAISLGSRSIRQGILAKACRGGVAFSSLFSKRHDLLSIPSGGYYLEYRLRRAFRHVHYLSLESNFRRFSGYSRNGSRNNEFGVRLRRMVRGYYEVSIRLYPYRYGGCVGAPRGKYRKAGYRGNVRV